MIARAPSTVRGHEVICLVVDDGSTDETAARARAAGAEVVTTVVNRGLGAAVRTGLQLATERHAVVAAFCDADGEYDPTELERVVTPILDGNADYVVGSRFSGTIESMRPHRRFGNRVLTRRPAVHDPRSRSPTARADTGRSRLAPQATPSSSTTTTTHRC